MVRTYTLVKIAAIGGIFVSTSALMMQSSIINRIKGNDYYRNALKVLRAHPGAIEIMGEPIKDLSFKLTNPEENVCDGKTARFKIPVNGAKEKGTYYFWADRVNGVWVLRRAELELKKNPDRRLVIVKEIPKEVDDNENTLNNEAEKISY